MKHIIEKHREAITISNGEVKHNFDGIPASDFPALISDLEAEWCKFYYWVGEYFAEYGKTVRPDTDPNWIDTIPDPSKPAEYLLKIYQNKEK